MKKTLLASCIALVSVGAHAELKPMSEFELHSVTGQAGVDIELDVGVSIGEIRYTDTAEVVNGVSDGDGGSIVIEDLTIGGIDDSNLLLGLPNSENGPNLDSLIFSVDVSQNGDLVIDGIPAGGVIQPVDLKITSGPVYTAASDGSPGIRLIDSMRLVGGALGLKMTVDGDTNDINFRTQVGFDDIDVDMSTGLGITIENAYFSGANHNGDPSFLDNIADISVVMYNDNDGVTFDFSQADRNNQNIFDLGIGKLTIGNGPDPSTGAEQVIGSFTVDDLNIRGVAVNLSGH